MSRELLMCARASRLAIGEGSVPAGVSPVKPRPDSLLTALGTIGMMEPMMISREVR